MLLTRIEIAVVGSSWPELHADAVGCQFLAGNVRSASTK
jgi:hypothetical protein